MPSGNQRFFGPFLIVDGTEPTATGQHRRRAGGTGEGGRGCRRALQGTPGREHRPPPGAAGEGAQGRGGRGTESGGAPERVRHQGERTCAAQSSPWDQGAKHTRSGTHALEMGSEKPGSLG